MATRSPLRPNVESDTKRALTRAARDEFARAGYDGTDTNKIARAAGFAPQTFYRWFRDKSEVFAEVYRDWLETERDVLESLLAQGANARKLADAIVGHHRDHLVFRRSLRRLCIEDPTLRSARAENRMRQIEHIRKWNAAAGGSPPKVSEVAVVLLQMERLADAIAEGELADLGLSDGPARAALAQLIERLSPRRD